MDWVELDLRKGVSDFMIVDNVLDMLLRPGVLMRLWGAFWRV